MSRVTEIPDQLSDYPVVISLPVLWGNMDALRHVNNTVPIRWFECGRVALLDEAGLSELMAGTQLGPILAAVECQYRRQIHYPDQVLVGTRVVHRGRSSLRMEHVVFSRQRREIACTGQSVVVIFDYQSQRPVRIPDAVHQALDRLEARRPTGKEDSGLSSDQVVLEVLGLVDRPARYTFDDLCRLDVPRQVADVGTLVPGRRGSAVRLASVLEDAGVRPEARYLGLHADADDFHASIPLDRVRATGLLVYRLEDAPLPAERGGPVRFLIPDPAACHTAEIDECASVKYVARLELTAGRGTDSRPQSDQEHARLHGEEA